jgi:hypothetical protein
MKRYSLLQIESVTVPAAKIVKKPV